MFARVHGSTDGMDCEGGGSTCAVSVAWEVDCDCYSVVEVDVARASCRNVWVYHHGECCTEGYVCWEFAVCRYLFNYWGLQGEGIPVFAIEQVVCYVDDYFR